MTDTISKNNAEGESVIRYFNPVIIFIRFFRYRNLIFQLTRRNIISRYKGSFLGLGWSFIQPLLMLLVYTFVFSVVFNARWGNNPDQNRAVFALTLFLGLITFGIFSEMINTSTSLIIRNANYVKKVVFPIEILPLVSLLSILTNALFSLIVLILGTLIIFHHIPPTAILLPVMWFPLFLFALGFGYFLASIGVFVRDVSKFVEILTTMLFFLSPIFYPLSAVPENLRVYCMYNPIAIFVENARSVFLWGKVPDWQLYHISLIISSVVFLFGFVFFMKSKTAFADVM